MTPDITGWINQLMQLISASQAVMGMTFEIVGLLWLIQFANFALGYRLNMLGIWPRKLFGLPGIIFSPLLHGNFEHVFFNSIPLVILVNILLLYGFHFFISLTVVVTVVSGFATWLFGRPGIHVGASGVLMGYWGFLLVQSIITPSVMTVITGLLCLYYLGSLWLNLLPSGSRTSWEGHVFGFLAGAGAAYVGILRGLSI